MLIPVTDQLVDILMAPLIRAVAVFVAFTAYSQGPEDLLAVLPAQHNSVGNS